MLTEAFRRSNQSTLIFENKLKYKSRKQTNLWIPPSQLNILIQLFASQHTQKEPWCTSEVMSPEELSFLYATKRGGSKQGMEGGCNWSALASFRGQIHRAAVAGMSGRHWMNLIN